MSHYFLAGYRSHSDSVPNWVEVFDATAVLTEKMQAAGILRYSGWLMPRAQSWATDAAGDRVELAAESAVLNGVWIIDVPGSAAADEWASLLAAATQAKVEVCPFQPR